MTSSRITRRTTQRCTQIPLKGGGAHRNYLPVISVVPFVALLAYAIHEQNKALSDLRDGDSRIVNICNIPVDGLVLSSRCMPVGSEKGGMK